MQCILTRVDYGKDLFEKITRKWITSLIETLHLLWLMCLSRPVLWRRHILSRTTPVVHVSLLWQDGLHRDVLTGACHLRTCGNLHRGGECSAHSKDLFRSSVSYVDHVPWNVWPGLIWLLTCLSQAFSHTSAKEDVCAHPQKMQTISIWYVATRKHVCYVSQSLTQVSTGDVMDKSLQCFLKNTLLMHPACLGWDVRPVIHTNRISQRADASRLCLVF